MISFLLGIILFISTSSSFAQGEVEFSQSPDEIQEITESSEAPEGPSFTDELRALGHTRFDIAAIRDPRFPELVERAFNQSNISLMSLNKKKQIFREQFKDSKLNELLAKFPLVESILADVLTDRDSIVGLIRLVQKERELSYFLLGIVILFILNLILKKMIVNPDGNFLIRFFQRMMVNLLTMGLTIGVLFYLFQKELSPIVRIVKSHF